MPHYGDGASTAATSAHKGDREGYPLNYHEEKQKRMCVRGQFSQS